MGEFGNKSTWVGILDLLVPTCVVVGDVLHLLGTQFPHL